MNILELLNDNQGVVSALGLFLVLPFSFLSERIIGHFKKKKYRERLNLLLMHELYINLTYVDQIEETYENNLKNENFDKEKHIPYMSPRTEVLEKFIEKNMIDSLSLKDRGYYFEIYAQLSELKDEYILWKKSLINNEFVNKKSYEILSSSLLLLIEPLMINMFKVWLPLVIKSGNQSDVKEINKLNIKLNELIRSGKWILICYKPSLINKSGFKEMDIKKSNLIASWANDGYREKDVFEIKKYLN